MQYENHPPPDPWDIGRVTAAVLAVALFAGADWHHPLYLGGGGCWTGRIRAVVHNPTDNTLEGTPLGLTVGTAPGQADLAGRLAEQIRVCNAAGIEMFFAVEGPDGERIVAGPIREGSSIILPVECTAGAKADYFIYFDNPAARPVPGYLTARTGLVNGDVERGTGDVPGGWKHDENDDVHRTAWTSEAPQSGKRCLKTVVAEDAQPTWIATRQHNIPIVGGARYEMRAFVKAQNVRGHAGWYIHLGNERQPIIASPMLLADEGTFDWRELTAQFTAPEAANRADLGTVLRGTGIAWFDNVTLRRIDGAATAHVAAGRPERLELSDVGRSTAWASGDLVGNASRRLVVRVHNFSGVDHRAQMVHLRLSSGLLAAKDASRGEIRVVDGTKVVPHLLLDETLLFPSSAEANSVHTYYVYLSSGDGSTDGPESAADVEASTIDFARLLASPNNLVENASFESGADSPRGWTHTPDANGVSFDVDASAGTRWGNRCVRTTVGEDAATGWFGWHQSVPVRAGRTYLLAGWLKTRGITSPVRLFAHCHDAAGRLCAQRAMLSVGDDVTGEGDWTFVAGRVTMPRDAARLQLHLTTNTTGTVWHDGLLMVETLPGEFVRVEGRPMNPDSGVRLWQVNAVRKVFPDDPAPGDVASPNIALARNEKEPLQLAVRAGLDVEHVRVVVEPPVNAAGDVLGNVRVNVVGYVPIDYPTAYYQSTDPAWYRKIPGAPPKCDGWPGDWPDPLLPTEVFDLHANRTQAVWITVGADKETPPGDYRGKVRLAADGETIAEAPLAVHVWDFTLPDESHVKAIYDVRFGPGSRHWNTTVDEAHDELVRFMAERRLCPDAVRPMPSIRYQEGRVVADFTEFDKAARIYFDEMKIPHSYTPWNFYLFGWGHPPGAKFGELPYPGDPPFDNADRSRLRPEFKRAYQACLRVFWNHLKENGWDDEFTLYISDEPFYTKDHIVAQMKALCDMIHEVDSAIPIYSSTWSHLPAWDGYLDVWGIGHFGRVPVEQMRRLREANDSLWFTTDGQMCTDTPYCAVERLLPHYCFKYDVEAYEFWGVAWLTHNPYRFGHHAYIHQSSTPGEYYWVRYPNGDGFLIYPGHPIGHAGPVSTVRLEQAREGVEDYEYLHLLRGRVDRAAAAGRDTRRAEKALQVAADLIEIPNAGGRYSAEILPDPDAVLSVRAQIAAAIEGLAE